MSRRRFRLSFGFVACLVLGFGGGACSEGIGGRCVQNSDCSSGFCMSPQLTPQGGRCAEPGETNVIDASNPTPQDAASDAASDAAGGTGGAAGGVGGAAGGSGGAAGAAGAGGTAAGGGAGGTGGHTTSDAAASDH